MKIIPFILALLLLSLSCKTLSTSPTEVPANTQESQSATENTATVAPTEMFLPPMDESAAPAELPNSALVDFYDPARNPVDDLREAIVIAQKENKNIMLELGGDWCVWCKYMDDFYKTHADILQIRAENYVLVKVNVSGENDKAAFLAQFPEVAGYPHIFILDSSANLIHSQDTAELEDGKTSYNPEVFTVFLKEWSP